MEVKLCGLYITVFLQRIILGYSTSVNQTESQFVLSLLNPAVYDMRERPYKNENKPVEVEVGVYFNNIADISEISMDMSISIFLRQMWIDPRLSFIDNPDFPNIITLHESLRKMMWLPDLYFRNEKTNGQLHELAVPNIMVTLSPTGYIFFSQRLSTKLMCIMSLQYFPMDSQNCSLEIEPYGHSADEIKLKWKTNSVGKRDTIELPEFNLSSISLGDCTTHYQVGNDSGSWACIYVQLRFDRLFNYYVIQVYVPSFMIVVLSWVSFWIDIHAVPARITLGLLTVLTITTQSSGVSSKLPKVSYIKGIDIWMFICTVFVFAALIEYSAVNVLARQDEPVSKKKKKAIDIYKVNGNATEETGVTNNIASLKTIKPVIQEEKKQSTFLCQRCHKTEINKALKVDILSRILFPAFFLMFNAFYWVYYFKNALFS